MPGSMRATLGAIRSRTRDIATTILDAGSAASIVAGVHMIYGPAAWIVAGLAGVAISWRFTPEDVGGT